jgi:hypothetical protein
LRFLWFTSELFDLRFDDWQLVRDGYRFASTRPLVTLLLSGKVISPAICDGVSDSSGKSIAVADSDGLDEFSCYGDTTGYPNSIDHRLAENDRSVYDLHWLG